MNRHCGQRRVLRSARQAERRTVGNMTLGERILEELRRSAPALDDDELAELLGVRRQAVNQECRRLELVGRLWRGQVQGTKIRNKLPGEVADAPIKTSGAFAQSTDFGIRSGDLLSENEIKEAVRSYLVDQGFEVEVAWGRSHGVDLLAVRGDERLMLEAKAEVARNAQNVNYFLGALGELVQRMSDRTARYGLALPDNRQFRGLVDRLPDVAIERLGLEVFFVRRQDAGYEVAEVTRGLREGAQRAP